MPKGQDKKEGSSIIDRLIIDKFRDWALPKIPIWLGSHHLTLMTLIWSGLIVLSGFLAMRSLHWFWLSSVCILLQWVTDVLDGSIGRKRNTGLIRWGFYMDHFLDYIFLCSILASYIFTLNSN